jgi:protein-S-isoprenylcysteine O-methyltransferase Ste14
MWALMVLVMGHFLVAGYDRGRLHFAGGVPIIIEIVGFLLVAAMWLIMLWAMQVNRFFSSAARLQPERGQRVITSGPYRVVRHPGYAIALLGCPANGLALGSWLAAAIGALGIPLLLWRCIGEDRMLRAGLPGYEAYAAHVRWRLIPGIW